MNGKTFRSCTRNLIFRETFFIMLKRNELVINILLVLYLVSIYDSYIFICVCAYVYHEYTHTWFSICVFVFYLLFGI